MKKLISSLVFSLLVAGAVCAVDTDAGQTKASVSAPKNLKVLMIGNSFSVCCLKEMPKVAQAMGLELDLCSLYIGGCSLERHCLNVAKADRPDVKPYEVTRSVNGVASPKTKGNIPEMLKAAKWDVVTIQQCSHESWKPASYHPYGDDLVKTIRALAPQAKIVVQETWSYTPWDKRFAGWKLTPETMYEKLHAAYADFAASYGFEVIPMGTAVQRWRRDLPVKYTANSFGGDVCGSAKFVKNQKGAYRPKGDVFHLNSDGHYLQALVWTAVLFNADVIACPYEPKRLAGKKAALMKRIARDLAESNPFKKAK